MCFNSDRFRRTALIAILLDELACFPVRPRDYSYMDTLLTLVDRPDPAVPDTQSKATVTMVDYRTVYFYAYTKLWITYGAAIASAAFAVAIGLLSMITHGAAYSNKFSTAFLAGRSAQLSVDVHSSDLHARDPLPSYLDRANVALKHGDTVELQPVQAKGSDGVVYSSVRQID